MKRALVVWLCLGLLLSGCTGVTSSTARFADLTIDEYPLAKESEGGLNACRKILADRRASPIGDGRWVLETIEEQVIVNGESLNDQLGYSKIFKFHMIAGKPFFFFEQDGKVRISYDGQILPQEFDKVFHYGCCDSVDFNPRSSDRMISFFGLRGDQWYCGLRSSSSAAGG